MPGMRALIAVMLITCSCGRIGFDGLGGGGPPGDGAPIGGGPPVDLELVAGSIGGVGNVDGTGPAARFSGPAGAAVDSAGVLYVADQGNHTIRKISAGGVVTTFAGGGTPGSADGLATAARFHAPTSVALDGAGNLYVADQGNHVIRKITPAGMVTTLAGTAGVMGSTDGLGAAAQFSSPFGVAVDAAGNVYVGDQGNDTIRKITPAGAVTTLAGRAGVAGSMDGNGNATFSAPAGVAVDAAGNVYVADQQNSTIRKITPGGVASTLAGAPRTSGSADGTGASAQFFSPAGLAIDSASNLYVADQQNDMIRRITAGGVVTTLAGTARQAGHADGSADTLFSAPAGVAIDAAGDLYVADHDNNAVRKIISGVVTTLAGTANRRGSADGQGAMAFFDQPEGVAVDGAGIIYVADQSNDAIRKIVSGVVGTFTGLPGVPDDEDGTGQSAFFGDPAGLAIDSAGNLYAADRSGNTLRKVTPAAVVTTLAGAADAPGNANGVGPSARFAAPAGVALDGAGNLYVADTTNHAIRKVTPGGAVTTLASAGFDLPVGVAVDRAGSVYVADQDDAIRKVSADGMVTVVAGAANIPGREDGTGSAARFNAPTGIALDRADNLYVADTGNHAIRRITPAGVVTTVAGSADVFGISLGATPHFLAPRYLAFAGDALVISDSNAILELHLGAP